MEWWHSLTCKRTKPWAAMLVAGLAALLAMAGCGLVGGVDTVPTDETVVAGATAVGKIPAARGTAVVLTNDNWDLATSNADSYRGSPVDVTGLVFNVLGDYEGASHYQIFTDPDSRGGNTHLAVELGSFPLREGDTIHVLGTLDHMLVTTSRGGDDLRLPYVVASSIEVLDGPSMQFITPTATATATFTPTETIPMTATETATATAVPTIIIVESPTATAMMTPTVVIVASPTVTATAVLTPSPTAVPPTATTTVVAASPTTTQFEARVGPEKITLSGSMANTGDAAAPNGHFYAATTSSREWNGTGTLPANAGAASFNVDVPRTGRYAVWVRMQYQTVDANSLWLKVDDRKAIVFGNEDGGYGVWKWVGWQDGNSSARVVLDLAAGPHSITIAGREAGTRFDSILVTDDTGFRPQEAARPNPAPPPNSTTPTSTAAPASPTPVPAPATIAQATAAAATPTRVPPAPTATRASAPTSTAQPTAANPPATATTQPTATKPSATATTQPTATRPPAAATTQPTATNPPATATAQPTATKLPAAATQPTATNPPPTATTAATHTPSTTATPLKTNTPPPTATAVNHPDSYMVQSGDTLWDIARRMYGDGSQYQRIYEANRDKLSSPDQLRSGTQLKIPK